MLQLPPPTISYVNLCTDYICARKWKKGFGLKRRVLRDRRAGAGDETALFLTS